jgi:protein-S-isoprenylcysteine O-methyltransferase Ste14
MQRKSKKNKKQISSKFIGYCFLLFQFTSFFSLLLSGPVFIRNKAALLLASSAVVLGFWAIYIMKIGNFNISPEPLPNGKLRTNGPYKILRHPMYTSLITFSLAYLIDVFSVYRFILFSLLLLTLILKLNFEEKLLIERFPAYKEYISKTFRILPFIY